MRSQTILLLSCLLVSISCASQTIVSDSLFIDAYNRLISNGDSSQRIFNIYHKTEWLETAYSSYDSAFELTERTLKQNIGNNNQYEGFFKRASGLTIDAGLELYRLTKKREFLEEVYLLDQRNKACLLAEVMNDTSLASIEKIAVVPELQRNLDANSSLLSFYISEDELLIMVISANRIAYYQATLPMELLKQAEEMKKSFSSSASYYLYQQLIEPVLSELSQVKRLIIVPGNELLFLPFEALQDKHHSYLVQRFSIQYQYYASPAFPFRKDLGSSQLVFLDNPNHYLLLNTTNLFPYADTADVIAPVWQPQNNSSIYIYNRFLFYNKRNYRRDIALQLAKIDLLKDPAINAKLKSPANWSQLILMGKYVPDRRKDRWAWVSVGIVVILLSIYLARKSQGKKTNAT